MQIPAHATVTGGKGGKIRGDCKNTKGKTDKENKGAKWQLRRTKNEKMQVMEGREQHKRK